MHFKTFTSTPNEQTQPVLDELLGISSQWGHPILALPSIQGHPGHLEASRQSKAEARMESSHCSVEEVVQHRNQQQHRGSSEHGAAPAARHPSTWDVHTAIKDDVLWWWEMEEYRQVAEKLFV